MKKRLLLSLGLMSGFGSASSLWAQSEPGGASASAGGDQLEEIVVTAERRTEDVQKTAASVSVRNGDDLNKEGRYSLQQVLEDVPGVTIPVPAVGGGNTDTPGGAIVIRGVQPDGGVAGPPTTATYTDGVYSGIGGDYDVDRVEVLRGPQGTLYGRSATGGVVATYTRDPELGKFGAIGSVEGGSYDLEHGWAAVNIPVGDELAIRAAGNVYRRDGYISSEGSKTDTDSAKVKLLYKPNDDLSVLFGAALQDNHLNSGGDILGQSSPNVITETPASIATAEDHFRQYWAKATWNLGFGTLTYLPAYRSWEQNAPTVILGPEALQLDILSLTPTDSYWTHELRLASNPGSTLIWSVGALYFDNHDVSFISNIVDKTGNPVTESTTTKDTLDEGVFGEVTYPFAETFRLTGGVRYDKTKISGSEVYTASSNPFGLAPGPNTVSTTSISGEAAQREFNNVTFKARVEKDLSPSNMAYAMVSTGFLPGNVQISSVAGAQPGTTVAGATPYDQEKLTAFEVGSKNRFLANTLQINGDVFYYNYTGYQASTFTSVGNPAFAIVTSPARMWGIELDGAYLITPQDRIGMTFAHINARYVNEPSCPDALVPCFAQLIANVTIPSIPANTYTASYEHTFELGRSSLVLHGDMRYASAYYSENYLPAYVSGGCGPTGAQSCLPYAYVDSQVIGNFSATWTPAGGNYAITAYVRNIADNNYKETGFLSGYNYAVNPPANSFNAGAALYDPRTVGVVLSAKF